MIIVCEPQCKGISHAQVNAGFLYGLRYAYPKDKIVFIADKSHFLELKQNVKHIPIFFNPNNVYSISGIVNYFFLIKKVFDKTLELGEEKILFLSSSPVILYIVKRLKQLKKYKDICCTFVLHGELEDIANIKYKEPYIPVIKSSFDIINHPGILLLIFKNIIKSPFVFISKKYSLLFKSYFRTKKIMMWRHSDQYKYISMSPHVTKNAQKYLDTKYLNFQTIILPIIFNKPTPQPKNKFIKFAVFGYGDSSQMQKLLTILSKKKIKRNYEIKIISMDSRGTEGFDHVKRIGSGHVLSRSKMEETARDVDVFINLYDKSRHKFGCSLSILESFSHLKPVLHLSNDGYNYFNDQKKPIGFKVESLNEFSDKMIDMIENYEKYQKIFTKFRKNMLNYRREFDINNNLEKLRISLTF